MVVVVGIESYKLSCNFLNVNCCSFIQKLSKCTCNFRMWSKDNVIAMIPECDRRMFNDRLHID
jgi:hypothetical protein